MSVYKRLQALKLDDNAEVRVSYENGCDVHHYTDDYLFHAIHETGIAHTLAEAITDGPLYLNGNTILEEMRDEGLLDDYERGSASFTDFVSEVIADNHWDYDWLEHHTERFDHKRGFTTFTLDFDVRVQDFKEHPWAFSGWEAQVLTEHGLLTLEK